ncbi:MAG TPA: hypothetical protein VLH86_00585 [Patescibacteria group bacterium]|nr:hypothetical protein [Patescibacteria group bacterium]
MTHIDGSKVVRPIGGTRRVCGLRWSGIEADEGEYIVTTPASPRGTDILVIQGADADFLRDADEAEKQRVVKDYDDELARPHKYVWPLPDGTPTRGHLAYLSGGGDVGHVKAVVSDVTTDGYLGRLQLSRQTAESARGLVAAELDGSDNPVALGIIALVEQVTVELGNAIEHELAMREQGEAYLGDIR